MNNKIWLKRIIGSVFGLLVFAAVMFVLTHTAQNSVATTQILPTINPDPVYVECPAGEEREITWKVKEDFSVSGFDLLLVNVSSESQGIFRMKIWNSEKELIFNDSLAVNEIEPGKWTVFPAELSFQEGEEYRIVIEADASDPYTSASGQAQAARIFPFVLVPSSAGSSWGTSQAVRYSPKA